MTSNDNWKQPERQLTDEFMNTVYSCKEYYIAVKINEVKKKSKKKKNYPSSSFIDNLLHSSTNGLLLWGFLFLLMLPSL